MLNKRDKIRHKVRTNYIQTSPGDSVVKNLPAMQEPQVQSLSRENPLEKEMATHPSNLAWEIPQTEGPGGLQSMGSQRVGRDRETNTFLTFHNVNTFSTVLVTCTKCIVPVFPNTSRCFFIKTEKCRSHNKNHRILCSKDIEDQMFFFPCMPPLLQPFSFCCYRLVIVRIFRLLIGD